MFRPHRFRRAWQACGAWGRRDPTLFLASFALWALSNGISLVATHDMFSHSPVYSVARELGVPEDTTGTIMILDGLALAWALGNRSRQTRSAIALVTGMLWCFWAFMLGAGGWQNGFYSSAAGWTFLVAIALMRVSSGFLISDWHIAAAPQHPSGTEGWND